MLEIPATMTAKGGSRVQMGDTVAYLQRYHVVMGSTLVELWADDEDKVLRVVIPSQKLAFSHGDVDSFEKILKQPEIPEQCTVVSEEVVFKNDDITLSGAIRRPAEINGAIPAVLFISGSGQQDRDGRSPDNPINLQSGRIALHLAAAGHVVLSYDDRGIGMSKDCCESISFNDEVRDAEAALKCLRSQSHVDAGRIFLIGHSSGALIASKLAGQQKDIAGVALMAAPGRPLREILVDQAKNILKLNNAPADHKEAVLKQQQEYFAFIESYRPGQKIPPQFLPQKAAMMWLKQLLNYDPRKDFAGLKCPVLILQAGKDLQVAREDFERIIATLKKNSNRSVRLEEFPDLDHLFAPFVYV